MTPNATNSGGGCRVALVGAASLKGKEIKEILGERRLSIRRLLLLDAPEEGGRLTEFEEEPAIIEPLTKESFENVALAIFASSADFTSQHWEMAAGSGCDIIDASYFLETHPGALLRAPVVESFWGDAGPPPAPPSGPRVYVPAHPVAIALALVVARLKRVFSVRLAVATVYEPVSEHGQAGVDELHQQTVKLLSFQQIPRAVFDSQVAFNMLSRYGEESRPTLHDAQQRIANHLRGLLGGRAQAPALRVLHAPVFYGHAFSCFVELSEPVSSAAVEDPLDHKPLSVSREADIQPSVVGVAGADEVTLGRVEQDTASPAGYWIWGALDNMRFAAINTVDIAERLIVERCGQQTG